MNKQLYKSAQDKKIAGVCGGLANFFNVSSTAVRVAWAIAVLCFGTGLLAYIAAAIIIPKEPAGGEQR
ncbi:MAG: PspC domain-containing protein [Oscillospiraceae bacterium]|jgi:phage shock protein PspC (stress-responsive transcriptional regulator)|nr:PspC domain-containing protein [Oscillospiraceae bacterium]